MTTAIEHHPHSAKRTTSTPGMFRVGQQTASRRDRHRSIALSVRAQGFASLTCRIIASQSAPVNNHPYWIEWRSP